MSIALIITDRDLTQLSSGLKKRLPHVDIQCWPYITAPEKVTFVVAWQPPSNIWQKFPNLKVISSLGAGCDGLLSDITLPENIIITRIVDTGLAEQMAEYVLTAILLLKRRFNDYFKQQQTEQWQTLKKIKGKKVAILGIGEIGHKVAIILIACGYEVSGWSRSKKQHAMYETFYGKDQLAQTVKNADFVVSTLPLTIETKYLLDEVFFKSLKKSAWLINVGRGEVLKEDDLLTALANNNLQGAILDVFSAEPLASEHPFWQHDNIIITPHISAITDQITVIEQLAENYQLLKNNKPLKNRVDRQKGY
ncbi:MAG: glyoxylate/hydroxypyruvate reductase A [Alteromonadaceae bacterium]|nr:glyoxylate/hydroxypyruvate reductase A [Alteromonadaceae bacterium]